MGLFWAVGVGPGDPELLTVKAVNVLRQAQVIYHAGPEAGRGRALDIIRLLLRPEQQIALVLTEAMSVVSSSDWRQHYRPGVERIAADCRSGRDVAFIAEGDPTLYSTASHVWQLLAEIAPEVPIEIVPGVSSITAAAARVRWPLAQRDEPLLVVPANYHEDRIKSWIEEFPNVCLLKPSQALPEIVTAGVGHEAVYVEELGTSREWITHDLSSGVERRNYFALVLVRKSSERQLVGGGPPQSGKVWVVGLGPGDPELLTRRALETLRSVDAIVGYERYLDSLAPLHLRAERHGSPIGAEMERARHALNLAAAGRQVALVSSGDAGVYGMGSLLLETAQALPGVPVEMVPGVTAATAAAALLGAPLGHDFACISLSDLLTPWPLIEERLEAAARADLVLALYNPLSLRRTWQLPRAREILLAHRRPETPVGLVDRAHRPGMRVWQTTLGALTAEGIGMETLVLIGNSQTHVIQGRMVTPRGYPREVAGRVQNEESLKPVTGMEVAAPLAGSRIMQESFEIIERELGHCALPSWAFAVVRRMIHASADFEFARALCWSEEFEDAFRSALAARAPIITDTEMVLLGIRGLVGQVPGSILVSYLNDPETRPLAESAHLTRSAAGIRVAARHHAAPLVVIGNAPTALDEALRLIEEENWRPAAIIGMPVGFVGVEEAKGRLLRQANVAYLCSRGRKGGSAVTAAAVNALVELCQPL